MVKANSSCEKHTVVTIVFSITNGASRVCSAGLQGLEWASHHHCSGLCLRGRAQATASPSHTQHPVSFGGNPRDFCQTGGWAKQLLPFIPVIPLAVWTPIFPHVTQLCSTHIESQNERKAWVWRNFKNHNSCIGMSPTRSGCSGLHPTKNSSLSTQKENFVSWRCCFSTLNSKQKFLISAYCPHTPRHKSPGSSSLQTPQTITTGRNKKL